MRNKWIILIATSCLLVGHAQSQTVLYDFNGYTAFNQASITDLNTAGTINDIVPEAATGLNGSMALRAPQFSGGFSAVTNAGALSLNTSSDFTITQSVYFNTVSDASGLTNDNQDVLSIGLTDQTTQAASTNYAFYTDNFINAAIRITDSSARSFQFLGTNSNGSFIGFGASGTLAADSWHLFTTEFAYDSINDEWDISRRLQEANSDGSIVALGLDVSDTFTLSNSLGLNPDVYGFFGGEQGLTSGITHFDNATLATVPEPSTFTLLGLAGFSLFLLRRIGRQS